MGRLFTTYAEGCTIRGSCISRNRSSDFIGEMRKAFFSKFHEVAGKKNSHPTANVTTVEEVRASAPPPKGHSLTGVNLFDVEKRRKVFGSETSLP